MGFRLVIWYQNWWPWMTLNGIMAIILPYFAEFGSFRGQLRNSGWLASNRFSPEKCHKVHQLSTTVASCFSRYPQSKYSSWVISQGGGSSSQVIWPGAPWCSAATACDWSTWEHLQLLTEGGHRGCNLNGYRQTQCLWSGECFYLAFAGTER